MVVRPTTQAFEGMLDGHSRNVAHYACEQLWDLTLEQDNLCTVDRQQVIEDTYWCLRKEI